MNKKPKQKLSAILKNNAIMLGKIARYTPEHFILMLASGLIGGAISSATAVFQYNLLNAVSESGNFLFVVKIIGSMAIFYLLTFGFDRWYWCIKKPLMNQKLSLRMHEELFVKAHTLDLSCFDDPEFYNDFVWAMNEADKRALEVLENTRRLIERIIASTTLLGLILTVDPVIALILFLSSCITIVCNLLGNKISFEADKAQNPLKRKKDYINRVYHLSDYAKELRVSRADELLMREYDENTQKLIATDVKYGKKYFLFYGLGWNALSTLTFFSTVLYMITLLEKGSIAIGGFAASVMVIWNIRWQLTYLIEHLSEYQKFSFYIEKYLEFMGFEPQIKDGLTEIPPFESLEFRNVSFSYEFSAHPKYCFHEEDYTPPAGEGEIGSEALKNVNLKISKGDKIAIVGYNGAGKTTLIKLMMRLYDPTEGEILYNGVNIKEYEPTAYRAQIGTVFQDFKIFATTIAENVMNGDYNETDKEKVLAALQAADFTEKLNTLEQGIHTHLTREFNDAGTNLSGGEAQKIAISRVFAKDYPIVIMDEPSSALDPMAEYNLNQSILHNTEGKTVIFISHRLSTTRIADKIYMFDTGTLIEEGSHSELLSLNGKYAEMFRVQSEKYQG